MNILVTGAKGFVGQNLVEALKCIRDGKDRTHPGLMIDSVMGFDIDNTTEQLEEYCLKADFVFHLAGVNRPKKKSEFSEVNLGVTSEVLGILRKKNLATPIMLASSIQASLEGRFQNSEYGRSKLAAEQAVKKYAVERSVAVYIYRLPNLFGKWCKPNYNSVIATFCNNIANDLPIQINDASVSLELLYIDDLVDEMLQLLLGNGNSVHIEESLYYYEDSSMYYRAPITHSITVGEIGDLLHEFAKQPQNLIMSEIPHGSFSAKLYATYLSYLPKDKVCFDLESHCDNRGSFTELVKTMKCGQFSVNVSRPGITKGQHWHNTKWELFIVVSGRGLIQERRINSNEVIEFEVSGDKIQAIHMLPGYTHNIMNLSDTDNLVTLMWASEAFDPDYPDTFFEEV